jgi:cytoskeletal protein CcmA (bactofilin family)
MFKKTEESEWTRFSRALGGREQSDEPDAAEEPRDEEPEENAPTMTGADAPVAPPAAEPEPAPPPLAASPVSPPASSAVDEPPAPPPVGMAQPVAPTPLQAPLLENVVTEGTSIEGSIRSDHAVRVIGSVQGEIESKDRVIVTEEATVNARITAENITIAGVVNGELTCPGRVEIHPTGRVTGGLVGGSLIMHDGAYFEGNLKMKLGGTVGIPRPQPPEEEYPAEPARQPEE